MIQISGLTKGYGPQQLFEDVSFSLGKGEKVGIMGRNGHGKTTLFRLILGLEEPDDGTIFIPRDYRLGYVSQILDFKRPSVVLEAERGLIGEDDPTALRYKVEAVLRGLGFSADEFEVPPEQLSGGFQVRLNLAKLLLSEPDLLLLDEPTNYLDIVSARWVQRFLRQWRGELLIITHDREFMDSVTTHTLAIHRKRFRKMTGSTRKVSLQIAQEEEIHEQTRLNQEKQIKETEDFVKRFRAKATKAKAVQSRIKALDKMDRVERLEDIDDLSFRFNEAPFEGRWLLRVEDLAFRYSERSPLLFEGLSFSVRYGDRIGVIGKNGRGKTTLLRVLASELPPKGGAASFSTNAAVSHFGQTNVDRLNPDLTVEQEILGRLAEQSRTRARTICGMMMFEGDQALKRVNVLSGGERSRVLLGKILASPSNMLLLDEPTNHLDLESSSALIDAVKRFKGGVVIVSHSEELIRETANRLVVFDGKGAFLFEGGYDDFLRRIGWEDEVVAADRSEQPEQSAANKKEMRRVRAERIQLRAKTLKPLEQAVSRLEREIVELEAAIEEQTANLIEMTKEGYGDDAAKASRLLHRDKEKVEALYDELQSASDELENARAEFTDLDSQES